MFPCQKLMRWLSFIQYTQIKYVLNESTHYHEQCNFSLQVPEAEISMNTIEGILQYCSFASFRSKKQHRL